MNVWSVLKNIGLVISLFKSISSLISDVAETKSAPKQNLVSGFLKSLEQLLDSGAIDIPGVDEKAVSDALKQIESQLVGQ